MAQETMKAVQLTGPCEASEMKPTTVAKPTLKKGYVLIKVKAFGVNESEVTSRKGQSSPDFTYPRILGIEGVGVVAAVNPGSSLQVGQKVATMMGGMGRAIDGSYAECMLVKEANVIPLETDLPWEIVGALPEMLQTSYGSLIEGLHLQKGDVVFIHGGSSTVGLMATVVAKMMGATIITTSRHEDKLATLKKFGADYALLDNAALTGEIKKIAPQGVDKMLELVGFSVLFKDLQLIHQGGYACFTGALDGQWTFNNFSPFMIPSGVFLTSYAGEAKDLPAKAFNKILAEIAKQDLQVPIAKVYHGLVEVGQAQANLESGKFLGKHVVVLDED